jgi:hypothetical protein
MPGVLGTNQGTARDLMKMFLLPENFLHTTGEGSQALA